MINFKSYFVLGLSTLLLSACTFIPQFNNSTSPTSVPTSKPTTYSMTNTTLSPTNTATKPSGVNDPVVDLKTKDGLISIRLFKNEAPNTVSNFLNKVNSGFYNGLTFHRVIEGFMAQGGDPSGNGTGGGKQPSELNNIPFVRGTIGLARTAETKTVSNDSQFFICFTTEGCQHLTSDYVNFGQVVAGLDILDKIQMGDKIINVTLK